MAASCLLIATFLSPLSAADVQPALSATAPLFSPEGSQVAFLLKEKKTCKVAVVPASGGEYKVLAEFESEVIIPQWFPDSRAILACPKSGGGAIWTMPLDGSGKKQLATGEAGRVSPDGRTLATFSGNKLKLIELASGQKRAAGDKSTDGWRMGPWLEAGRLTALNAEGTLLTLDISQADKWQELVPHKTMENNFIQAAACAGRRLLALTSDDMQEANPENRSSIWFFDWTGKEAAKPVGLSACNPVWTDKGDLFFSRRSKIFKTTDLKKVTFLAEGETWTVSPDGTMLVVSRRDADTNGDGIVNWLDAARLYRVLLGAKGVEADKVPLVAVNATGQAIVFNEQKGNPVLGALFTEIKSEAGEELGERTAECRRTLAPPKIDGLLDDGCWKSAEELTGFYKNGGMDLQADAAHQTHVWFLFDDIYLYVAARAEHPDIANIRNFCKPGERDGDVWRDEDIDLCFDITHSHQRYYQFIIGCGTSFYDMYSERVLSEKLDTNSRVPRLAVKAFEKDNPWNSAAEFATRKEEKGWTMEGRIPLADMGVKKIADGTVWGLGAARLERGPITSYFLCSRWCPALAVHFNEPQWFGHLVFGRRTFKVSDIAWGVGHGKCVCSAILEADTRNKTAAQMRLSLDTEDKETVLGETEVRISGQPVKVEIPYVMPENIQEGNLVLGMVSGKDFVGLRSLFFTLPPSIQLIVKNRIMSTRTKALEGFVRLPYGRETLKDMLLKIEVRNLSARTLYRGQVEDLQNTLACIRIDTALIGMGKGVLEVSLVKKDGALLGKAVSPFEIMPDPFADELIR